MERTTSELVATIESQKEQLKKYEAKLRDVVRAYKGLQKEKEALEASFRALSQPQTTSKPEQRSESAGQRADDNEESHESHGRSAGTQEEQLQKQINTLSASLATLTEEKSRLEASYLADKKKMVIERDAEQKKMQIEVERKTAVEADLQQQLLDLKGKIRAQQLEHDAEQTNHGIMLKELQLLLSEERSSKEQLEVQLENMHLAPKETNAIGEKQHEQYERRVAELSGELARIRKELKEAHNQYNIPSPMLLELQTEMEEMKRVYQDQISEETRRANDAELRLNVCGKQSEERICSLEAKLSEVSSIIGNYDDCVFDQEYLINFPFKWSEMLQSDLGLSEQGFRVLLFNRHEMQDGAYLEDVEKKPVEVLRARYDTETM